MKYRYGFLLFFAAFLLQSTVLIHFRILGVTPNLILCLVVVLSFLQGESQAAVYGIIFGLLQDICFGQLIGIASMGYFLVVLGIFFIKHLLYQDNIISTLVMTIASTVAYNLIYWGILYVFEAHYHFVYMIKTLPIQMIWNCFVTAGYYLAVRRRLEKNPRDRYVR